MKNYLLTLMFALPALPAGAFAAGLSVYTPVNVDSCITYDSSELSNDEIDHYQGECPGLGGYRVFISGGDIRYSLQLMYRDKIFPLEQLQSFHDMGSDVIEWRYTRSNGNVEYIALIYRLTYQVMDPDGLEPSSTSKLVVVRLAGENTCVIGTIEASEDMNEMARKLADNPKATCRAE